MTTTFDAIRAIIARDFELPPERLQRDTPLDAIELDSLAITELVFAIEDEFKITAESTIPTFKTLGDIADYVARLVAERDRKPRVATTSAEAAPAATTRSRPGKNAANGADDAGAGRKKSPRVAKHRPARAGKSHDAPPRKPKRPSGGRAGARAR
jgi:acyl carrier protein